MADEKILPRDLVENPEPPTQSLAILDDGTNVFATSIDDIVQRTGVVRSVRAGVGVEVDNTDPRNPIVSAPDSAGDMPADIYDPQGISNDAFNRANHTGTQPASTITGLQDIVDEAEAAKDAAVTASEAAGVDHWEDTYADAEAALSGYAEGDVIGVFADETKGGATVWYRVESGALVEKLQRSDYAVAFEAFGAKGDGSTSDADAIEAAFNSEVPISGKVGSVYLIDRLIMITDKMVNLADRSGWKFKFSGVDAQIVLNYSYSDIQAVVAVDNTTSINMNDGTGATATPTAKLTVADGTAYSAGDVVKVVADDLIEGTDPSATHRIGEHAVVFSVDGDDVYLDRRLSGNGGVYSTNVRIAKASPASCRLGHIAIDGNRSAHPTRSKSHIRVSGCADLEIGHISGRDTQGPVAYILSCFSPRIGSAHAEDGKTVAAEGAFGHCLLFGACTDINVGEVSGRNMRHLIDTSGSASATDDEVVKYGEVIGGSVGRVFGVGMQAPPASTHSDAQGIRFGSVVSLSPIHGPNGYFGAVGLRGKNHHVEYAECENGDGVRCFSDYGSVANSYGHSIGDIVVRADGRHDQARGVMVQGSASGVVAGVSVRSITFIGEENISPIVRADHGSVFVERVANFGNNAATSTILCDINAGGSVEIREWIGRDAGKFTLIDIGDATGVAIIDRVALTADAAWGYLANLNNNDAYLRCGTLVADNEGVASDLIQNRGTSADIVADWTITSNSFNSRIRHSTVTINSAAGFDIAFGDSGAHETIVNLTVTAAGGWVDDIGNGHFFGQRLVISNKFDNIYAVALKNNASGVRLGSDVVLSPGESVTLFWDDADWRLTMAGKTIPDTMNLELDSATPFAANIGARAQPLVYVNVLPSVAGAIVNSISSGAFVGQEIILQNKYEPSDVYTNSFDLVDNAAGKVRTGANNITIASGASVRLIWDGFHWRVSA